MAGEKKEKGPVEQIWDTLNSGEEAGVEEPAPDDLPVKAEEGDTRLQVSNFKWLKTDWSTGLPVECPVQPLGISGDVHYYLDCLGQMRAIKAKDHTKNILQSMFSGQMEFIFRAWPRFDKDGFAIKGQWKAEIATNALMQCGGKKGVWNPAEKVRGRGAWKDDDGNLIIHFGGQILSKGDFCWPGIIDGMVYPAEEKLPLPAEPNENNIKVAAEFAGKCLTLLESWQWRRRDIDPILMLGWLAAGKLGGALDWRPLLWVTGGSNTGKSTLQQAIKSYLNNGLIWVTESTQAYIQQRLGHSSLPILLDEMESEEDNRKNNAMVKLARQASSGGRIGRGGSDHKAVDFTVQSAFMFSSILIPPLLPQDRSRIAVLELQEFHKNTNFKIDHKFLNEAGNAAMTRLIGMWDKVPEFLDVHKTALSAVGHTARGCDQYGALLGLADLMLNDEPNPELAKKWAKQVDAVVMAEDSDDVPDQLRCLNHLLTHHADHYKSGINVALSQVVADAVREYSGTEADSNDNCYRVLASYGMRIYMHNEALNLAVANSNTGLVKIFANTQWAARSGAGGGWPQALKRLDGATKGPPIHIGVTTRTTCIPLKLILSPVDYEAYQRKGAQAVMDMANKID
ncbi:MAG: hypothetical protein V3T82_07995 [Nitrospinaceae bacterium]